LREATFDDLDRDALDELMLARPVGWALSAFHVRAGAEAGVLDDARTAVLSGQAEPEAVLRPQLRFLGRRSLVVLGDPRWRSLDGRYPAYPEPGSIVGEAECGQAPTRFSEGSSGASPEAGASCVRSPRS
jgi:hypothetical protein